MNVVILQGYVTHEPLLKYITVKDKKVAVCNFSIATHRYFKKANGEVDKETTFIDCEIWDSGAENISKYVSKGERLLVRGSLKQETWEKDGQKRNKIRVRVEEFDLPVRPKSNSEDILSTEHTDVVAKESVEPVNNVVATDSNEVEVNDGNDIPF